MGKIRFYEDATVTGFPTIKIGEGQLEGLVMMVDTGSNDNVIFGKVFNQWPDRFRLVEGKTPLYGIDGKVTNLCRAEATLSFCGHEHDMLFLVKQDDKAYHKLSEDLGFPIAGLIGTNFMAEHDWMIDYGKQEIVIPDYDISFREVVALSQKK